MKVFDSKKINAGKPVTFQQGQYHVVKCWDLSVFLMNVGEKMTLSCPAYLSNGGSEIFSHMGSKKVPANSPIVYEIEVLECNPKLEDVTHPTNKRFHKKHHNWVHTKVDPFFGDNTHDSNGIVRREGGGPSKDYVAEVDILANKVSKKSVENLKKIVSGQEKTVNSKNKALQGDTANVKTKPDASKNIKKEGKVMEEQVVVEKNKDKVKVIEQKLEEAKTNVKAATETSEEIKNLNKV